MTMYGLKLTILVTCVVLLASAKERGEQPLLRRRVLKRDLARDLGPVPYTSHGHAPLPYQLPSSNGSNVPAGREVSENQNPHSDDLSQVGDNTPTSQRSGRHYYRYQPPVSTGYRPSSQTHVSNTNRYTFTAPVVVPGWTPRAERTYTYPFGGDDGYSARNQQNATRTRQLSTGGARSALARTTSEFPVETDEAEVRVYPSQQPVDSTPSELTPRQMHEQLLRQRMRERQQIQQQRQLQSGYANQGQEPVYTGNAQDSSIPGSQQRQSYSTNVQQQFPGSYQPLYPGQQIPVFPYGQIRGHSNYGVSGYSSECPDTGIRIQINGYPCVQAIERYGSYLCYRHEYTSHECCERCRLLKDSTKIGCEYGDHSGRCDLLHSYDCYDLRNRQSCCQTCERFRKSDARVGCEYGDMTPNCDRVRQSPGLCYIPENRHLCCETCANIRDTQDPVCPTENGYSPPSCVCHLTYSDCPWGDQNFELCEPFDRHGNIRINCYSPPIRRICCKSCERLQDWIPGDIPNCEYGDRPVAFNTGTHQNLNCTSLLRYFGSEQCSYNQAVANNCCYTCHRYSLG